jgi:molybdopterin synthase sulfur carrier subunit
MDGTQRFNQFTIHYFAWVRERVGRDSEQVSVPVEVTDISGLIDWLIVSGDESYAHAFEHRRVIRAAIDHHHVCHTTSLCGATEIAFFPPVTGG